MKRGKRTRGKERNCYSLAGPLSAVRRKATRGTLDRWRGPEVGQGEGGGKLLGKDAQGVNLGPNSVHKRCVVVGKRKEWGLKRHTESVVWTRGFKA